MLIRNDATKANGSPSPRIRAAATANQPRHLLAKKMVTAARPATIRMMEPNASEKSVSSLSVPLSPHVIANTWGLSGTDNEDTDFSLAFGSLILIVAGLAAVTIFLANKWRRWLAVAAALILGLGLPFAFFASFLISMEIAEEHQRLLREELDYGKYAFGDQPALFAIAHAIVKNDQGAIRAAAKAVPDLQAPGRDGTTLLCFAVRQSWQHRQLVEAVKTLLSLGADPNYTNDHWESFALDSAVHSSAPVLRAMLEAGGNPNARSEYGWPIIFMHFE